MKDLIRKQIEINNHFLENCEMSNVERILLQNQQTLFYYILGDDMNNKKSTVDEICNSIYAYVMSLNPDNLQEVSEFMINSLNKIKELKWQETN